SSNTFLHLCQRISPPTPSRPCWPCHHCFVGLAGVPTADRRLRPRAETASGLRAAGRTDPRVLDGKPEPELLLGQPLFAEYESSEQIPAKGRHARFRTSCTGPDSVV